MKSLTRQDNTLQEEWYFNLIDECKAIITEASFTSRWALVEGYHLLGKRIREEEHIEKWGNKSVDFLTDLSIAIGLNYRTLYRTLQFYDKYPDLGKLPEGKDVSWNKIVTKYLPDPKEDATPIELPEGEYNVIYADPPWCYNDKHEYNGTTGAETHYSSMTIEELCSLKIPATNNAVLFLWVTSPLLEECFPVIRAWGFEYKTSFVWDKVKHNMGHYNSVRHEFLLVCTRGSFTPEVTKQFDSVVTEERSNVHSQKPEVFYKIIETLYPNGKYLEMFARNKRKGWTSWGNEI